MRFYNGEVCYNDHMSKSPRFWQKLKARWLGQPEEKPPSRDEIAADLFRRPATATPSNPVYQPPQEEPSPAFNPLSAEAQAAQKALPACLLHFWKPMMRNLDTLDYTSMRLSLLEEYPQQSKMALALFAWYGHNPDLAGWPEAAPAWYTVPEQFLLELPLTLLVEALEENPLDPTHLAGARRLFGGDLFSLMRGHELAQLPSGIQHILNVAQE